MKFRCPTITQHWDYALVAVVSFAVVYFRIFDWQTRLAMVSGDDSLAAMAFYFARPAEYSKDAYIQAWAPIALASMENWIPALAYKFATIHPRFFFVGVTIGQFVGLALAMFYLATAMTNSRIVAWLTAVLTIFWQPNWWNLALVGGLDWMPYANWSALPFLICAFALVVNDRRLGAYACLLIAAMIHPIMGMLGTIIATAHIAYEALQARNIRRIGEVTIVVVTIGCLSGLPILISTYGVPFIQEDRLYQGLANPHVRPWGAEYPFGFSALLSSFLYLVTLIVLAWSKNSFFRVSVVVSAAMIVVHFGSVLLGIPSLMNVIASRASILMVLIALPLAVATMWKTLETGPSFAAIPILVFFFKVAPLSAVASALAVRGGLIGGLFGATIGVLVLATHTAFAPIVNEIVMKPILGETIPWTLSYFLLASFFWKAIGAGLIGVLIARLGCRAIGAATIVASVAYAAIFGAQISGRIDVSGKYKDYRDAQLWARDHTDPASAFILLETIPQLAWRSLSERPVVTALGVGTAYRTAAVAKDYNNRLVRFYSQVGMTDFHASQLKEVNEDFWHAFAKEFGANYLVRPAAWPSLALTEVYRNASFVIYKL